MSNHTPGPWHQHIGRIGHPSNYDVRIRVGPPGEAGVADVWAGGTSRPIAEQKANARLVSAAPDLLAACEAWAAAFEALFGQCLSNPIKNAWGEPVDVASLNEANAAASAAIAKATGEPQS